MSNCVSDFFDAFFGRSSGAAGAEIIEMFAMRKIDSAETRKGKLPSPRQDSVQVEKYEAQQILQAPRKGCGAGDEDIIAVAFSF